MAILQFKIKSEELDSKTDVIVILPTKTVEEMRKMPDYGFYQPDKVYQVLYLYLPHRKYASPRFVSSVAWHIS